MKNYEARGEGLGAFSVDKTQHNKAQIAEDEVRKLIIDAVESVRNGQINKAQLLHSFAYTAYEQHRKDGTLSPEAIAALDRDLHTAFSLVERDEAA